MKIKLMVGLVCCCQMNASHRCLSYSEGGERHSSMSGSAAGAWGYVDHRPPAALHHPRQHQSRHQSGGADVPVHPIQHALLGNFNQALGRSRRFVHTVHQEADVFTPQGLCDRFGRRLAQREVGGDDGGLHPVGLGEEGSGVSYRGAVLRDEDDADAASSQLLCISTGYRLSCTCQQRKNKNLVLLSLPS